MDGWRRGWIAVTLRNGTFVSAAAHATAADAIDRAEGISTVGIDIPIGFPAGGVRAADVLARKRIGARRSSVFDVPPRDVMTTATYAAANQLSKDRHGRGLSKQSYALRDKILEVDAIARTDKRIFEVHPEVTFAAVAPRPLHHKKSWAGMNERRELLRTVGIELPSDIGAAGVAPVDDVLDAAAVAWTADRIARGVAEAIPADPEFDGPLRMAIWV
jgi:predicted RNase H-like nuclease